MKRFTVYFALSFLLLTSASCEPQNRPPTQPLEQNTNKQPATSLPQPPPTNYIIQPSATPYEPPPTLTPYYPPTSTTDPNLVSLPYSSDVPPSDVLAQIAYSPTGGGGPDSIIPTCEDQGICVADNSIALNGYSPFQQLRILVYTSHEYSTCDFYAGEYVTEWYVTVDGNGYKYLSISGTSPKGKGFIVYDANTGAYIGGSLILPIETFIETYCTTPNATNSCPGAPPQRMTVNKRGYVCTQGDSIKLREFPRRSGSEITLLNPSTGFYVLDGPSCSDNWSWWKIQTDDGTVGWISEGGDNTDPYFICPSP